MPLHKTRLVLKKTLPKFVFNIVDWMACETWEKYISLHDLIYYHSPRFNPEQSKTLGLLKTIRPYTMVNVSGLVVTYNAIREVVKDNLMGDFVECGVARGGCAALMALVAKDEGKNRNTWLFDSFEGLPKLSELDGHPRIKRTKDKKASIVAEGYCYGSFEEVEELMFGKLRLDRGRVLMVKGWYQDTFPKIKDSIGDIVVLRMDSDLYESTKYCLENLYDKVVSGGYILIDDYALPGCKLAVDEFLAQKGVAPKMTFDICGRACWVR